MIQKEENQFDRLNYKKLGANGFEYYIPIKSLDPSMKEIMEDVSKALTTRGVWEPETEMIMRETIKKGDRVIDIGASIGYFTLLMADLVGNDGMVYSYEPTDNQFKYLQKNVAHNGFESRVYLNNAAASDKYGVVEIQCNACNPKRVCANALDGDLTGKIDFIKMDIDGSEAKALKGLTKTIEDNENLKMIIEFIPEAQTKLGNNPEEMMKFIDKYFTWTRVDDYNLYCIRKPKI